jgi:hypothetical protein
MWKTTYSMLDFVIHQKRCDGSANDVEFTFRPKVYQNSMCIAQVDVAITLRGVSDYHISNGKTTRDI